MCKPDMESSFSKVQPQVFAANTSNLGTPALAPPLVQGGNLPMFQTGLPQAVSRYFTVALTSISHLSFIAPLEQL